MFLLIIESEQWVDSMKSWFNRPIDGAVEEICKFYVQIPLLHIDTKKAIETIDFLDG